MQSPESSDRGNMFLFILLLFVGSIVSARDITSRIQEYVPRLPDLPPEAAGAFVAVSKAVDSEEAARMAADVLGRPLGADPYDLDGNDDEDDEIEPASLDGDHFEGDIAGVFLTSLDNFRHNGMLWGYHNILSTTAKQ